MEIKMPAPRKSLRPKARTKKAMKAAQERAEAGAVARGNAAARRLAREEAMTEAMMGMKDGGKLKMVKGPGGKMVPDYAADGVGKMAYGGKMKKVKKMGDGGMCRGMGAATRGGNYKMG
jgi:hypothetical protein